MHLRWRVIPAMNAGLLPFARCADSAHGYAALLVSPLLRFRQFTWFVVRLAVQLLHFFAKVRAVIAIGIRQRPGLTLVIPIVGIEALRRLEMRNRVDAFPLLVKIFTQSELGFRASAIVAVRFHT